MPDVTVASGSKEKIISQREARVLEDPDRNAHHYIVDVSGDSIRLATDGEKEQIRHGFPVPAGSTFTLDPMGNAIVAFGDGSGQATVNVQLMKFQIGEFDA